MTTEVIVTGTGVPHVAAGRAGPGVAVRTGDLVLQFDAGRATTLRLAEAGIAPSTLTAVFVTHQHSDHLSGLTDLLFTRWLTDHERTDPLPVVVPEGQAARLVAGLLDPWHEEIELRAAHIGHPGRPHPAVQAFGPSGSAATVWSNGEVRVSAVAVHHEPVEAAVAYRVETPDGVVVISGDTVVCEEVSALARDADVLVHEACRRTALAPLFAHRPHLAHIAGYHADTVELGSMAARCGVGTLVLTHLIPAPRPGPAGDADEAAFADDVRRGGYDGAVIVARDLTTVAL